ncbi:MAG TPA: hypothetical protein VKA21_11520 [Candidatus Binatia bacterium]|nr:hypothetical protein [Candidatus Binatia bacterium]
MPDSDRVEALLVDIRDAQRALLDEYRRVANDALALQRQAFEQQQHAVAQQRHAVDVQARAVRFARVAVLAIVPLIAFLVWLLVRVARPWLH